jgi:hypothetical protein
MYTELQRVHSATTSDVSVSADSIGADFGEDAGNIVDKKEKEF